MNVIVGDGSTISVGGEVIGGVQAIRLGGGGYDLYDATNMATTGLKPFLQSLAEDGGELSVEYNNASSQKPARGLHAIVITLSDASTVMFSAMLQSHESTVPKQGIYSHSMRLKITAEAS